MGLTETFVFYSLIGIGIGFAVLLAEDNIPSGERAFRIVTAVLFWPLYVPILLRRPQQRSEPTGIAKPATRASDEMSRAIAQVERELDTALTSLDGWAEDVLAGEHGRFSELRAAWNVQAARIRELDHLLAQPDFVETAETNDETHDRDQSQPATERLRQSERGRQEHINRLRELRRQMYQDLMSTLAWVRELATMIHLAKYTGAPASRADELVTQIAAAVEGLSEVTNWRDEPLQTAGAAAGSI